MATNYSNILYKDYEELSRKFDKQEKLLKDTNELVKTINNNIEI